MRPSLVSDSNTFRYGRKRWHCSIPVAAIVFKIKHLSCTSVLLFSRAVCWSAFCRSGYQGGSTTAPSNVTAGIGLSAALLSSVHNNVCALFGLTRDLVSWHYWDTLFSCCCTASAAYWVLESLDVLCIYMSPSSASVRILLGPFWFRSVRPRRAPVSTEETVLSRLYVGR